MSDEINDTTPPPVFTADTVLPGEVIEFANNAVTYMGPGSATVREWRGDTVVVRWMPDIQGERGRPMPNLQAIDANEIRARKIEKADAPRRWVID